MQLSRQRFREIAQFALKRRGYDVTVVAAPRVAPGARLTATKGAATLEIAVRTSQRREVGMIPNSDGRWKGVSGFDWCLVVVPSKSSTMVEVICFNFTKLAEAFDEHVRKHKLQTEAEVPLFVKLDAILFGKSTSPKSGPKLVAWRDEFPADEMGKRSKVKQVDEFINRVTREFADLVGVDAERVAVDFRISSEASKQAREP